ncbi:MAG: citramalate synthase [Alphaproteobacteria bacterium]|nr:citramalate synthase [Alphaproteobacteria bacterium]
MEKVYLYDSTLRDGAQTHGVDFSAADKVSIAKQLDRLGIDYIEGGWPGANPTDDAFFKDLPSLPRSRISAFGMTRRSGRSAENDPGLQALFQPGVRAVCMVGKSWDFQVEVALGIALDENIRMIGESVAHARGRVDEAMFDAEHFFDGYLANPAYALACVKAAYDNGARWVVLCDTNGGMLPHQIGEIVGAVAKVIPGDHIGIHCHNDSDNAVGNSLAAVRAGARQVQGTLNGLGERCGNANLISIIPNLMLKMGFETGVTLNDLTTLTHVSRMLDDRLNRAPNRHAPFVGDSAFAHKGGLHVSAIEKDPRCYEHIKPELVGNRRHVVVSDQSGRSNVLARFREIGIEVEADDPKIARLLTEVKRKEYQGLSYDNALASFEILARRVLGGMPEYFRLQSFKILDERRYNAVGEEVTPLSEAIVKLHVKGRDVMTVAEGHGPVGALDAALRKALADAYPSLAKVQLVDYKVRILTPEAGTAAVTRVMIESKNGTGAETWNTVGVSDNVISASYDALQDSFIYKLMRDGVEA